MSLTRYFATCGRGIESVLAQELRDLGAADITKGRGGVGFAGDHDFLYKANLWLRTAIRVLKPILECPVTSPDELYDAVRSVDWSQYLTPDHTLAVDSNVRDSHITHSQYAALRVKDAICDQFIERGGRRPSVDVETPMIGLNLHIYKDDVVLSLDSAWDSLHKRGYRPIQPRAPLNEALAAALILLTGWTGETPLVDPFCGSGTLSIEACWMAIHRPPGLTRRRFGFQGWMDYDVQAWTELRDEARRGIRQRLPAPILGFDLRADAIDMAVNSSKAAGVGHLLRFDRKDIKNFRPPDGPPGTVICNPPYGERIGEEKELIPLYQTMGEVFGQRFSGWDVYVFTGNPTLAKHIGLPVEKEIALFNGKIPCRLLKIKVGG